MAPAEPSDRQAYLEEQIQRQKRGEPIDVAWVKAELERIRNEQATTLEKTQRRLRLLVIIAAIVLVILWLKNGGLSGNGGIVMPGLVLVSLLAAWILGRNRR